MTKVEYYEHLIHDLTLRLMILKASELGPSIYDVIEFLDYLEKRLREANAR